MYTFDSRIRYSETDEFGRLSITGVMNYLQDCSTFQSEDVGLGLGYLKSRQRAWWLTSWQIVVDRYPCLGERVSISTWPYDFKGIYGYRNFAIQDRQGRYLVRANSLWFFFDTAKGRPVKVQEEDVKGYGAGEDEKLKMDYAPRKVPVPGDYQQMEPLVVAKHHIDTNHHVNNAQYVEMAREFLPDRFSIKELRVEYRQAAVFGDLVVPRVSRWEEGYTVALCDGQGRPYAVVWLREQETERK